MTYRFSGLITICIISVLLCSSSAVLSNGAVTDSQIQTEAAVVTSIPYVETSNVTIDGIVSENEYLQSYTTNGMTVYWEYNNQSITVALSKPDATGWLAIGFTDNQTETMAGSNMIMGGLYSNGTAYGFDRHGSGGYGVQDDTNLGGNDNLLDYAATEVSGGTVFEFIFEIDATDTLDPEILYNGTLNFFIGFHNSNDDHTIGHDGHSAVQGILFKPLLNNIDTVLSMTGPEEVEQDIEFTVTISLKDIFDTNLDDIPIKIYRETQFGEMLIGETTSALSGSVSVNITIEGVSGDITIIARSTEIQSNGLSYLSSEGELHVHVHGEPVPEEPAYISWTRAGLLIGFWSIGVIIWSIFGYNLYAILQIYLNRNEELPAKNTEELNQ